ncbi:MAG: hypothetical protein J6N99_00845 [Schwartzia sp.]|nr:hypothetical protein [Schwartzia sp. (in: firmicutes)]MBP3690417.1 hypothetical protein [Schwartzia sp. (in: firmicutes)]
MRKKVFGVLIGCALLLGQCGTASADIGGEIGVYVPVGGGGGYSRTRGSDESFASFSVDKLVHELTVQKKSGRLLMEFRVSNGSDAPYTVEHQTGQAYEFLVLDKRGKVLWRWSEGVAFTQALTSSTIEAHGEVVYKAEIARKDFKKFKDDAVVVMAYIVDTPYTLSAAVPETVETSSSGAAVFGAIVLGSGPIGRW